MCAPHRHYPGRRSRRTGGAGRWPARSWRIRTSPCGGTRSPTCATPTPPPSTSSWPAPSSSTSCSPGCPAAPAAGTEVWAAGMGSSPGGIANLAVATARLGLRTSLAAALRRRRLRRLLLADARRPGGHRPLPLAARSPSGTRRSPCPWPYERDRSMVTHGHEPPISADRADRRTAAVPGRDHQPRRGRRRPRAAVVGRAGRAQGGALVSPTSAGTPPAHGTRRCCATLAGCHAFLPNAAEAMAYTRTDSPQARARALAELVPLAVVTLGGDGAIAIDAVTGETAAVPALVASTRWTRPAPATSSARRSCSARSPAGRCEHRLRFANLSAGLSVQRLRRVPRRARLGRHRRLVATHALRRPRQRAAELAAAYGFLDDLVPRDARLRRRRAGHRHHRPAVRTCTRRLTDRDPRTRADTDTRRPQLNRAVAAVARARRGAGALARRRLRARRRRRGRRRGPPRRDRDVQTDPPQLGRRHPDGVGPGGPRRPERADGAAQRGSSRRSTRTSRSSGSRGPSTT